MMRELPRRQVTVEAICVEIVLRVSEHLNLLRRELLRRLGHVPDLLERVRHL